MKNLYIFKSKRLGFRNWTKEDLPEFAQMNADLEVMKYFPNPLSRQESAELLDRLQKHFGIHGYTYLATEILATGELIGFIGLAYQEYETVFTPATDIGWRLKRSAWGKGFATEGAKRCLEFAFGELGLEKVISTCTIGNEQSEKVMKKIGMIRKEEFMHPELTQHPDYQRCICYEIEKK